MCQVVENMYWILFPISLEPCYRRCNMLPVLHVEIYYQWNITIFLQEPDFQENEFMYDDFDLEENIASCKCFDTGF